MDVSKNNAKLLNLIWFHIILNIYDFAISLIVYIQDTNRLKRIETRLFTGYWKCDMASLFWDCNSELLTGKNCSKIIACKEKGLQVDHSWHSHITSPTLAVQKNSLDCTKALGRLILIKSFGQCLKKLLSRIKEKSISEIVAFTFNAKSSAITFLVLFLFFPFRHFFWKGCRYLFSKRFIMSYQKSVWPRSDSFLGHIKVFP